MHHNRMTIEELCGESGIAPSEARLLLAHALGTSTAYITAHPEQELSQENASACHMLFKRRAAHEPVAYLTGTKEFYGKEFRVNPSVLIPRPSTEALIDATLSMAADEKTSVHSPDTGIIILPLAWGDVAGVRRIVDVGTGSGCIAVTLACRLPRATMLATDISSQALHTARANAELHGVSDRITFAQGDALEPAVNEAEPFVVVSNPPYIPSTETVMSDVVRFEPHAALFAGVDGCDVIRRIAAQARAHPLCVGIVLECRTEHESTIRSIVGEA